MGLAGLAIGNRCTIFEAFSSTYRYEDGTGEAKSNKSSAVAEMGDRLATIDIGQKLGAYPFSGRAGPHLTQCRLGRLAEAYLRTKWHLDPSSRLATIHMGQKLGAVPFFGGELGHHLTQVALAEAYLRTKWHLDPSSRLATIDMGRKLGAVRGGGAGSPSNTMWLGPRPTYGCQVSS